MILGAAPLLAQSDPAQFTTIYNTPPDVPPVEIGSDTQLNIYPDSRVGQNNRAGAIDGSSTNVEVNFYGGVINPGYTLSGGVTLNLLQGDGMEGVNARAGSVINVYEGQLGSFADLFEGSTTNVYGGRVGLGLDVRYASTMNVFRGRIDWGLHAHDGSNLNLSGGALGNQLLFDDGAAVTIEGAEFRLNGDLISGLDAPGATQAFDLPADSTLSGTLADGTPFAISNLHASANWGRDSVANGTITLQAVALPPVAPELQEITVPANPTPLGVRDSQTLTLQHGGYLPEGFQAGRGSRVVIEGGGVNSRFEAVGAQIVIDGGSVGSLMSLFNGSELTIESGSVGGLLQAASGAVVNVHGGTVRTQAIALSGSTFNIRGGVVGPYLSAREGAAVHVSGGLVKERFQASPGSVVTLSGGRLEDRFSASGGSSLSIVGDHFRLDGEPIPPPSPGGSQAFDLSEGSVLSGVFADGTPFAFSDTEDTIGAGALTLVQQTVAAAAPRVILAPRDEVPVQGLRTGQTLVVSEGGVVGDNFNAEHGSRIVINGGQVGENFEVVGAEVSLTAGVIGERFGVFGGSRVEITGGAITDRWTLSPASQVVVVGGQVGSVIAERDSQLLVTGGHVSRLDGSGGHVVTLLEGAELLVARGSIDDAVHAGAGSAVNVLGTQFLLDGQPIEGLAYGAPFTVSNRGAVLSGSLLDGAAVHFSLYNHLDRPSYFHPAATLTLTLLLPGDYNHDTVVDSADYELWRSTYGQTVENIGGGADGNFDGVVDAADYTLWRDHLGESFEVPAPAHAAPEPAAAVLALCVVSFAVRRRRGPAPE